MESEICRVLHKKEPPRNKGLQSNIYNSTMKKIKMFYYLVGLVFGLLC